MFHTSIIQNRVLQIYKPLYVNTLYYSKDLHNTLFTSIITRLKSMKTKGFQPSSQKKT